MANGIMKKLKKKVSDNLRLPSEYALNSSKISILEFSEVEIINYKSIVEYGENVIRINTDEKLIKLSGEGMNIENITDDEVKITGKINSLLFE